MDDVGKLIRHVGPRQDIDPDRVERARARVEAHWESVVSEHRKPGLPHLRPGFAAAASVMLMVAAGFFAFRPEPPTEMLIVARVVGEVRVDGHVLGAGDTVPIDGVITTAGDSRVALQLPGGQSLRIDQDTQLAVNTDRRFRLVRGAVYFDSGRAADAPPVFIETPYGIATDVGTQFQVRLLAETVIVGVREGLVALSRPGQNALTVDRGHVLEVADDGGATRRRIEDDSVWEWVTEIAPEIDTNGMTLASYLDWYARENGYELEWADAGSRDNALATRLSVSIGGLGFGEGLALVEAVAPFDYEIHDTTMRVLVEP